MWVPIDPASSEHVLKPKIQVKKGGGLGHQDAAQEVFFDGIRVKIFRVWVELSSKDKTQGKIKL